MFLSFSLSLPQQKIIAIYSFLTLYQTFLRELSACSTFTFQIRSYLKRNWEHVSGPKTLRTSNFSSHNPLNHGSSHCCTGIPPGSTLQQWITHLFSKSTYCTLIHTLYPAQPCTSRRIRINTFLLLFRGGIPASLMGSSQQDAHHEHHRLMSLAKGARWGKGRRLVRKK